MLSDYLGRYEEVCGIKVYPVRLLDWEEFSPLANKFLLYGYDFLWYRTQAEEDTKLFDLIVAIVSSEVLSTEDVNCKSVKDIERLFSISLRKFVKYRLNEKNNQWELLTEDGNVINRDNYDSIRDVIMRQNLIHEPLIVEDEYSQEIIDNGIKALSKGGGDFSFESMVSYVCCLKGIDAKELDDYSYYRLRCDIEMLQRVETNRAIHIYRSQGAKASTINEFKGFECKKNPYSWEALFTKYDSREDDKMAQFMSQ